VDLVVYNGANINNSGENTYTLQIIGLKQLNGKNSRPLSSFANNKTIHAVAGIGYPARFFNQLTKSGLTITEHAFKDHHKYQQHDFSGWHTECIIMTEKDAVKCRHLSLPDAWIMMVNAELSETLEAQLDSRLLPLLNQ